MTTRTSLSHPILIDHVPAASGRIGMTLCPGKQGDSIFGPPWARDLGLDLHAIRAWGADALVSLTEASEEADLGVADLGAACARAGLDRYHLPIRDVSVPDDRFESLWVWAGRDLRRRLRAGDMIVLHCRGGLGRSGMIAGRLLVEMGADPDAAIAAIRAARPGTIETGAQEAHVRAAQRAAMDDGDHADRVLGCLLGGAVGDGFGYGVEFDSLATIRARHGPDGLMAPLLTDGRIVVSDDTQMTLFTAAGLLACPPSSGWNDQTTLEAIRRATLDWYRSQTQRFSAAGSGLLAHRELWARRAPGNTCLSACAAGAQGTPERPMNNSKGCGGVMRTAPIGLVRGLRPGFAFDLGARAAAQTHGHPSGYLSAAVMAFVLRWLTDCPAPTNADLDAAVDGARKQLDKWEGAGETRAAIDAAMARIARPADDPVADVTSLGQGWVGEEALAIGLYAAARGRDFAQVFQIASNHDGDSDSTASIAGQIHGAMHGLSGLLIDWIGQLDVLVPVTEMARAFIAESDQRG